MRVKVGLLLYRHMTDKEEEIWLLLDCVLELQ